MSRRLKLKSETLAAGQKAFASVDDIGREVRVRPLSNPSGRLWRVIVVDVSEDGLAVQVGQRPKPIEVEPVPAKRKNRGFGRRRWVRTINVVAWRGKMIWPPVTP